MVRILLIAVVGAGLASSATAQVRQPSAASPSAASASTDSQDEERPPVLLQQQQLLRERPQTTVKPNLPGRIARSSAGQVGQRQTRFTAAEQAGIEPMARIANRVQNRIRNRIDRN